MGIHRACVAAGIPHEIVGVDWIDMPRYPFQFRIANAMAYPLDGFDFIWASPPCQAYTSMRHMGKNAGNNAPDLVARVRDRLLEADCHFAIENVMGAPLNFAAMLCGSSFGLGVQRHRRFEASFLILTPACKHDDFQPFPVWGDGRVSRQEQRGILRKVRPIAVYGDHPQQPGDKTYRCNRARTLDQGQRAMGINWMDWRELTQAVPPAYSEFVFKQFLQQTEVK